MKHKPIPVIILVFSILIALSCKRDHFISDSNYRKNMEARFEVTKKLAKNRSDQLFRVFDQDLKLREKEALQFLFAYMPLSDLADYDGEFYLKNVRSSFAAKDTFSWGKMIPEEIFRHFVVPIRVNNENLDSSRWVFFSEIKDRIKKLSMKDAALEVNHWCHEKVTYKGSDSRTSSPLASVKTAYGRCGEESTFTVAALRSACIPARQCYTPRWAHGDDNHAWVEVWVDGKWHYLGACEPEADLDMAWFTGPAKRAMLVNTNVFGEYSGKEDVLVKDPRFTKINVLPNYTDTKRIFAKVIDQSGRPVDSAAVEFHLYNYAEFYPLTRSFTDTNGLCSFLTGYGDLLVWAAKSDRFGYMKVSVKSTDTAKIVLPLQSGKEYTENYDFVPPPEIKVESTVSDSLRKKNTEKVAFEDKIRANYETTFIDSSKSYRLAQNLKMNGDTLWMILKKSRGNWRDLVDFITDVPAEKKSWVFPLLMNISEKDLRDVTPEVLSDNLPDPDDPALSDFKPEVYNKYILSPRIDNECLKPFKARFRSAWDTSGTAAIRQHPEMLIQWVHDHIIIDNNANWGRAPLTPAGVFELRVSDPHSRDIFFVALCRSFGIPARIEPATGTAQFLKKDQWVDWWYPSEPSEPRKGKGTLVLENDKQNDRKPEYYIHFTIEKLKDGFYRSLDYENDPVISEFPCRLQLNSGSYLLVTGNRIAGGTVYAKLSFFNLPIDSTRNLTISLRKDLAGTEVFGRLDMISFLKGLAPSLKINEDKGVIMAWLDPLKEPSRHFIADLAVMKPDFTAWKGNILLFFRTDKEKVDFIQKNGKDLPSYVNYSVSDTILFRKFTDAVFVPVGEELPVITYVSRKSEIIYLTEGYRIGSGDGLLKALISDLKKPDHK